MIHSCYDIFYVEYEQIIITFFLDREWKTGVGHISLATFRYVRTKFTFPPFERKKKERHGMDESYFFFLPLSMHPSPPVPAPFPPPPPPPNYSA